MSAAAWILSTPSGRGKMLFSGTLMTSAKEPVPVPIVEK